LTALSSFWWYSFCPLMVAGVMVLLSHEDEDQSHCVVQ
jgi:hypothetical protein